MQVYVIRHTPVDIPKGYCYGQTDLNLLNSYKDDLAILRSRIPTDLDCIISSPLKRCSFIAEEFSFQYETEPRLIEMNFGTWEMQSWDDIPKEEIDLWNDDIVYTSPPYGENLYTVQQRVNEFLDELRLHNYKKVLLITHGGPIRCMWNYLLDLPLENTFRLPIGFQEVFIFHLGRYHNEDYILEKQ